MRWSDEKPARETHLACQNHVQVVLNCLAFLRSPGDALLDLVNIGFAPDRDELDLEIIGLLSDRHRLLVPRRSAWMRMRNVWRRLWLAALARASAERLGAHAMGAEFLLAKL